MPRVIVTGKLGSYGAARRELLPNVRHLQDRWRNNRAEGSHQPSRQRERQMRRFKSMRHAQRFLSSHGAISNLFRLCRHGVKAPHCRILRGRALRVATGDVCPAENEVRPLVAARPFRPRTDKLTMPVDGGNTARATWRSRPTWGPIPLPQAPLAAESRCIRIVWPTSRRSRTLLGPRLPAWCRPPTCHGNRNRSSSLHRGGNS